MSLLNFNDESPNRAGSKKSLMYLLGIGTLVGTIVLSSTFASSINLNSGAPVEFGQGVVQTTACDDDGITVTPFSTFVNAPGAGSHKFTSLKISGIDSSPGNCSGKTFLIKAYGDSGLLPLFSFTESGPNMRPASPSYDFVEITNNDGVFSWTSDGTDGDNVTNDADVGDINRDLTETSFVISLSSETIEATTITRTPLALSEDVKRITVETYDTNLLSGRVLSASQVGIASLDGLFLGDEITSCTEEGCFPYFTLNDYLDDLTEEDVGNFNEVLDLNLTLPQIISGFSIKFTYDPSPEELPLWNMEINFLGTNFAPIFEELQGIPMDVGDVPLSIPGYVIGFDGNVGAFLPYGEDQGGISQFVVFSLNSALQSNSAIDYLELWPESQPGRTIPIRDFASIWVPIETPYSE